MGSESNLRGTWWMTNNLRNIFMFHWMLTFWLSADHGCLPPEIHPFLLVWTHLLMACSFVQSVTEERFRTFSDRLLAETAGDRGEVWVKFVSRRLTRSRCWMVSKLFVAQSGFMRLPFGEREYFGEVPKRTSRLATGEHPDTLGLFSRLCAALSRFSPVIYYHLLYYIQTTSSSIYRNILYLHTLRPTQTLPDCQGAARRKVVERLTVTVTDWKMQKMQ